MTALFAEPTRSIDAAAASDAGVPTLHHTTHQNGGSDEVATATAGANAIPKAGGGGTLAIGWIPLGSSSSTVCVGNDARLTTPSGLQNGVSTLSSGTVTVASANITANSRILVTYKTPGSTLGVLSAKAADRSNGTPGSFKIYSLALDGTTVGTDTSLVDWLIIG